ncbi:phage tail tape measure protein [Azoarcus indigens]|uniref:TP901 family phage tail tape measure protein n=1 Tax=Azoarcus indigens TaxID=29545 RepID=A0A4R6E0B7_9RHOO|nr:phage tail tape measure protein [Azoarcus indigens]NMG64881.1 phage tail tape measure protein [Azoarcus indigens]TDN50419.1 TP901 family phage tail tape measure protein [Azoarcus indigens]
MADKFQLKALITGVDKLTPVLGDVRRKVAGFRKELVSSGLGNIDIMDIAKGGAFAYPFVKGIKEAINFESAMSDVRKVVDFETPAQFQQMGDDITKMSYRLPMLAKEISAIFAAGGQAGFAREELAGFAEDAVKMGIAFDQTADQSGEMMAKWRTSFKLTQAGVVDLADKINYLSNNGPASAQQISSIVTAIGPLGKVAGLASSQIAAMGATLAGVGVKEEVAGTGMKNFMLTLTAGAAATKQQRQMFAALRMDSKQVAAAMQKDAQGTIIKVLTAISKVDKAQQASVLTTMFGRESIGAIAPMLTNLDLLKKNFEMAGDAAATAGSMEKEYAARADTTANSLVLLQNRALGLAKAVGNVFTPGIREGAAAFGPIIEQTAEFVKANPWVIKGLVGAAVGFAALRIGVLGLTVALKVMNAVTAMSPLGLLVRGIALGAGLIIANWSDVGPWFGKQWDRITGVVSAGYDMFLATAGFNPLAMIIKNWEPIVAWFSGLWERIRPYVDPIINGAAAVGKRLGLVSDTAQASTGVGYENLVQQTASTRSRIEGDMTVRFEGAPPGMRVEPAETNQPGLSITPRVGYRSLAMGGA